MNQKPLFLAIVLTALLIIGGVFWMMQRQQVNTNRPVIADPITETPVQTKPGKYSQHIEAIPGSTDEVWYNIPELGVRMRLNRGFAEDLVYSYSKSNEKVAEVQKKFTTPFHETVHFSSRSLLQLEPSCEPGTRAIGYFIKEVGSIGEWSTSYYVGHTQLSNFFVVFGVPASEDNPKVPMCILSQTSRWALQHIPGDELKMIEHFIQNQSGLLGKGFSSLESIPRSN